LRHKFENGKNPRREFESNAFTYTLRHESGKIKAAFNGSRSEPLRSSF